MNKRAVGALGEQVAVDYYTGKNYRILGRNLHFGKLGELDIVLISEDGETLVVSEVKLRKNKNFGDASLAVNGKKQNTIRMLTMLYLQNHPEYANVNVRFDVCEVYPEPDGKFSINTIEAAF